MENLAKRCNDAGDGGEARWRTGRHAAAQLGTEDDLRAGAGQVLMEHIVNCYGLFVMVIDLVTF